MKILIFIGGLFLFTGVAFAKSSSPSVSENCSHNVSKSLESGKYDKLLSFLETKNVNKRRKRTPRGKSTGKR